MKSGTYKIIGRPGAGSLIAEFLLEELAVPYEIQFVNLGDKQIFKFESHHPQGRIPLLICPDGTTIFETLAIVNHITNRFNRMIPKNGTNQHDRFWQFLALFATSLYSGYHRQHHSWYYVTKDSYEDLRNLRLYRNRDFAVYLWRNANCSGLLFIYANEVGLKKK